MREIDILYKKFLSKKITQKEEARLMSLLNESDNIDYFKSFLKINFFIDAALNANFKEETKDCVLSQIRREKSVFYRYKVIDVLKYAAVVLFFIGSAYLLNQNFIKSTTTKENFNTNRAITITLENGEKQILDENGTITLKDQQGQIIGTQSGELLDYSKKEDSNSIAYNTISIPQGKRFNIKLSDGTLIYLNSGSTLTYPINFINGEQRQVVLRGEAYFEVESSHDPFVVITQNLSTTVLGTSFNVSSFEEDGQMEIVLVEGSVELRLQDKESNTSSNVLLRPGFKASVLGSADEIKITDVNVDLYTSWTRGILIFNNASFKEITAKLGRYYNVKFINNSKNLSKEKFNAKIRFNDENIEQVMSYFKKLHPMNYEINGDEIYIN